MKLHFIFATILSKFVLVKKYAIGNYKIGTKLKKINNLENLFFYVNETIYGMNELKKLI